MSDYFASAFIRVKADPKQLRTDLDKLKQSVAKQTFRIPVKADARGFKKSLQEQVSKTPISIPVKPDTKGFRSALRKQLADLTIPVKVVPTGVKTAAGAAATPTAAGRASTGAAAAAATGVAALTKEEQRLLTVEQQLIATQIAFDAALEEGITAEQQEARLQEAIGLSKKLNAAATQELAAAYAAESAALISTLEPLRERAALQRLEIESAITRGTGATATQAAAEKSATSAQSARRAVLIDLQTAELRYAAAVEAGLSPENQRLSLERALSAAERAQTTVIREMAVAYEAGNAPLIESLTPLQARTSALIRDTAAELENIGAQEASVAANTAASEARVRATAALAIDVKAIKSRSELTKLDNSLTAISTELKAAEAAAIEIENTTLAQNLSALERRIVGQQQAIAAQRTLIASEKEAAAAHALAAKGFGATGLAALGARGATLAASAEFLVGAAAATAFFKAVSSAAHLETELNVFQVTAGATADEMERVAQTAQNLGRDITLPGVGAGDAAEAMTELAKAGLSVSDSLDGTRGVLQLATAAEINNAEATELVASALNAFGLAGEDAVRVADLLTGSAIESQGSISDMGIALQQSAAAARQAGLSVEDTVALLTLLARNGLKGSDAGTSLRTALIRLINPTDKASDALNDLNVSIRDSSGNVRAEAFADLGTALGELTKKQRDATLAIIFGQDAFRAASIFAREGTAGLNTMRDATQQVGLTAKIAGARTQGFAGQMEAMKNQAETLGIEFGQAVIPTLELVIDTASDAVGAVLDLADAFDKLQASLPGSGEKKGGGVEGFFKDLGNFVKDTNIVESFDQFVAAAELTEKLGPGKLEFGKLPTTQVKELNAEIGESLDDVVELSRELQNLGQGGDRGPVGKQIEFFRGLKEQIVGSSAEANKLRARIDDLIRLTVALGRAPTAAEIKVFLDTGGVPDQLLDVQNIVNRAPPIEFDLTLDERKAKAESEKASAEARNAFDTVFTSGAPIDMSFLFGDAVPAAQKGGADAAKAFKVSFDDEMAIAEASGESLGSRLARARAAAARSQTFFDRIQGEVASGKRPKGDPLLAKAAAELNARNAEVERLSGEIESNAKDAADEAKKAADDVVKARNDADQHFLDAMGGDRRKKENAVLIASGTAGLADDISAQKKLRDFIKRSIGEAQKTLKDAKTKAQVVGGLTTDLISANQRLDELNRQLQDSLQQRFEIQVDIARATGNVTRLRKLFAERIRQLRAALADAKEGTLLALQLRQEIEKTRQDAFDAINESFELDISFAETTGNKRKEIKAREAFIAQLQREQALYKKGTLEYKRLRNQIAEQRKAIAEVEGEKKKENDGLARMEFEFLQTQQGFASNLLGNLIPGTLKSGLVGGTATQTALPTPAPKLPGAGSRPEVALANKPVSAGQGNIQIQLLREIRNILRSEHGRGDHPEVHSARQKGAAAMDISYQGTHGG